MKSARTSRAPLPIADWPTKRAWVAYAFDEMRKAGYQVSSAYTMVKDKTKCRFVYRDSLWHGADMFGTGVASFGHVNGVHLQNVDSWDNYVGTLRQRRVAPGPGLAGGTARAMLIREMILQLKTGRLEVSYFRAKFNSDILVDFDEGFRRLESQGDLEIDRETVSLTSQGYLQVDRLLSTFFLPEHLGARYT